MGLKNSNRGGSNVNGFTKPAGRVGWFCMYSFVCYFHSIAIKIDSKQLLPYREAIERSDKERKGKMKLVWCPDTASKAYIDTVKSCEPYEDTGVAEMVSAMAGGWNPELIVETWSRGGAIATSIGLAQASRHTGGRHVCIVEDEESRSDYVNAFQRILSSSEASHRHRGHQLPEIMVGEAEEVMSRLSGVDFLVVDRRHKEKSGKVLGLARLSHRGAVLVYKNAVIGSSSSNLGSMGWRRLVGGGARVVRSVYVPVGKGLEIAYIGGFELGGNINSNRSRSRWVTHIDCVSGEEHVFRT